MATDDDFTSEYSVKWTTSVRPFDRSPIFRAETMNFHLEMNYGRRFEFDSDYRLYLVNKDGSWKTSVIISLSVIIGTTLVTHCRKTVDSRSNPIWCGVNSDLSSVVPDVEETHYPFTFKIVFYDSSTSATAQRKQGSKFVQTSKHIDPKFELENLSRDFSKLLEEDRESRQDVQVVCGDRTWKAHANVLSARSDVFDAMLRSDMLEGKTGLVDIQDTSADRFQEFLQYLYTGRLPELTVDNAMQLYELGDRYAVAGIKESCASFLTDSLARDNACAILSLADRHSDQAFRHTVVSYILVEKIPLYKEHWSDFCKERPEVAVEVYDQFIRLHCANCI